MKKFILKVVVILTLFISFSSCEESDDDPIEPSANNQVVFWSNFQGPPIQVKIEGGVVGTITAVGSTSPSCDSSGNVTRSLSPRTYSFSAKETSSPNRTWSGTFTIKENTNCLKFKLYK